MEILTLGEKIKQKRKEQNMTLKDLAGDKVTPGQLSLVESGKSKPSIDLLEYIAQRMNISLDYILETEEHQAEKLCQYYSKIASASLYAESYEQAQEAISKGMIYARDYNLQYFIGLNELYMGKIEYGRGNYENAQSRFISANEVFLKNGKIRDVIETYVQLGLTGYKLSHYDSSLNYFKHAERLVNEHRIIDDDILMKIFYNISLCYSMIGNNTSAVDYVLLAMEKLKKKNDRLRYGQSLLMVSTSYKNLNRLDDALEYANMALSVFKELENLSFVASIETSIGTILADIGNMEDSFKHLENAYRIKADIKDKSIIVTMLKMAENNIKLDNFDTALDIVNRAYEICIEENINEYYTKLYSSLHKLYLMKDDKRMAELCLIEGIKHLQGLDMKRELADICILLGEFYEEQGNSESALKYLKLGINEFKNLKFKVSSEGNYY